MTSESQTVLFGRLLQLQYGGLQTEDLFVRGSRIIRRRLPEYSSLQGVQSNISEKFTRTGDSKQETVNNPITRSYNDGILTQQATKGRQFTRHKAHRQFGGGWDRENNDNIHDEKQMRDGLFKMDREAEEFDASILKASNERREMNEEEREIYQGLDFLNSRNYDPVSLEQPNISYSNPRVKSPQIKNRIIPEVSAVRDTTRITYAASNTQKPLPVSGIATKSSQARDIATKSFKTKDISTKSLPARDIATKSLKTKAIATKPSQARAIETKSLGAKDIAKENSSNVSIAQIPRPTASHHETLQQKSIKAPLSSITQKRPSIPDSRLKTAYLHDSKKLLQMLLSKSRQNKRVPIEINQVSSNQRKLLSYPSGSNQSEPDNFDSFFHYTRRQYTSTKGRSKLKAIKEALQVTRGSVSEEVLFDSHWQAIKPHIKTVADMEASFSLFIYGRKRQSLLGSKVALLYPQANVINVFPKSQADLNEGHRKLMKSLPHSHGLVFSTNMSPDLVNHMYTMPDIFKFQILSLDVFDAMIFLGDMFPYYLGQVLALAETTFLEIPHFGQLTLARKIFVQTAVDSPQGLIASALRLVGAETESVELLRVRVREELHSVIVRITLKSVQRKVKVGCGYSPATLSLLPDSSISLHMKTSNTYHTVSRNRVGFSLDLIKLLGLNSQDRAILFQEYLKLTVHSDMCPAHILWVNQRLKYWPLTEEISPPAPRTRRDTMDGEHSQKTFDLLLKEMKDKTFSFMDYNSRDNVGFELASQFPNSTFISLLSETHRVTSLLQRMHNTNISNIVLNLVSINSKIMNKLLKCPDFLRYQFMDYGEVLQQMKDQERETFDLLIGQMIATGVTSFIQVPSSKILSLAALTFFSDEFGKSVQIGAQLNQTYLFREENHPLDVFKNAEDDFLLETAKADVDISVSARTVSPSTLSSGAQLPWKLVRVDVRKLQVQVDHHFDYAVDGHTRKYTLHCSSSSNNNHSNKSNSSSKYSVYLVRGTDGFKIPYGNVNAISLIALLRMGLEESFRDKFYTQFLKLPLYEDMAPWNIVFRAGRLEYIDYDSKDFTFNKMASAAYQIMAMLMNYKRTVQDFGRCKSKAKTAYGFDIVAECVSSDFVGPCTDIRYPVPCGDHTCRATYIDCLQALQEMEQGKAVTTVEGLTSKVHDQSRNVDRQWSFNLDGPSSRSSN